MIISCVYRPAQQAITADGRGMKKGAADSWFFQFNEDMASSDFPRSPLENVLNFVPQGHEKALKHAFYNAAGMIFVFFGAAAATAVYFVLQPFVKPLLWAVLFGSVLHPFKHSLACLNRKWLRSLRESGTPLSVGIILLPIGIIEYASQSVGHTVHRYLKSMATVTIALATIYFICAFTPESLLKFGVCLKDTLVYHTHDFFGYFSSIWIWSLVVGFLLIVIFYWTTATTRALCTASIFIWIIMLLHMATILGSYRAPVFIAVFTLLVVGFCMEVNDVRTQYKLQAAEDDNVSIPSPLQTAWSVLTGVGLPSSQGGLRNKFLVDAIPTTKGHYGLIPYVDKDKSPSPSSMRLSKYLPWADRKYYKNMLSVEDVSTESSNTALAPPGHTASRTSAPPPVSRQTSTSSFQHKNESEMSNVYIYSLIWACILVELWTHSWILPLLIIPIIYLIIKRAGSHIGLWSFLLEKFHSLYNSAMIWLGKRKDALFPAPIRGIGKLTLRGDSKVTTVLEQSTDVLTTIGTILLVIIFVLMATIFLLVQIHAESMHLVKVTSNLINNTVVHNPDIQGLLPEGVSTMLDSMFDNAYEYGQELTVKMVKNFINEKDEKKAAEIEQQVLELWDKVYTAWMESGQAASAKISKENGGVFGNLMAEAPGLLNLSALIGFVKENIDTFMAVLETSWTVLKGNISLALSALTATLSLLFGGGTALLNFLFSFFVFITALFYLLSASGEKYKPIVLFNKLTPPSGGQGNRFGQAVEEAINGVFAASFKMAFFYGLWTWLIHKFFQVKIVYIPSALAAVFGAMPFLGTFWAVVPAVLEIWLIHGQGFKAILMLVFQILPMSCVDTAIYSEIRGGGHPYLTGLAVAGGIFCLGAEGAIIGPILLCSLYVAMNMYGSMMQESPINEPSKRLLSKAFLMKSGVYGN